MVTLVVLLLSVVGIGAVVFWANYSQLSAPSRTATAQPAVQPPGPVSPTGRSFGRDDAVAERTSAVGNGPSGLTATHGGASQSPKKKPASR